MPRGWLPTRALTPSRNALGFVAHFRQLYCYIHPTASRRSRHRFSRQSLGLLGCAQAAGRQTAVGALGGPDVRARDGLT